MKVMTAILTIFTAFFMYVLIVDYWQLCAGNGKKARIIATYTNDSMGIYTNGYTIIEFPWGNQGKFEGILGKPGDEMLFKSNSCEQEMFSNTSEFELNDLSYLKQ